MPAQPAVELGRVRGAAPDHLGAGDAREGRIEVAQRRTEPPGIVGAVGGNGFKLEVESLISKDISYVTEEYVPARLKDRDFLD